MTLVVAILNHQTAFMMSDILITSKPTVSGEQDQPYPTQSGVCGSKSRVVSGLCQKVIELKAGLFLGLSGNYNIANTLVKFLRYEANSKNRTRSQLVTAQKDFLALHHDDAADLSTIVMSLSGEDAGLSLYTGGSHKGNIQASVDGLGEVIAIGSGAGAFLRYVDGCNLSHLKDEAHQLPLALRQTSFVLEYIVRVMIDQYATGNGLDQGWGGAFELVLSREPSRLEKFGSTILAACFWELNGDVITIMSFGKRYLKFYEGEDLLVFCQDRKCSVESFRIAPPDRIDIARSKPFPLHPGPIQMLCILMINRSTQKPRFQVHYNQNGHQGCGYKLEVGMDYAIRINTGLLTGLIRQFALSDAT